MPQKNVNFADMVRTTVRQIPAGETRSYGEIATLVGRPGAARAVARVMSRNFDRTVPCHRVIRADGSIGEYNRGGPKAKLKLLQSEGWTRHRK